MKVGAFSWTLGKPAKVEALPELSGDAKKIQGLKRLGLDYYRIADEPCSEMMISAILSSLELSGCDPLDIDTVIFSMSKFNDRKDIGLVPEVLGRCGLLNSRPIGISLGACANLTYAFEVCEGLIKTEKSKNILIVFSDFYENHARLLRQNAALGSDGVGACIISDRIVNGYVIKSSYHKYNVKIQDYLQAEDIVSFIRAYSDGVRVATEEAIRRANISASDCQMMVTPNFNHVVLRNLSKVCGISVELIYPKNITSVGHCSSVDQLISLSELLDIDMSNGAPILVSCPADFVWGASVLMVARDNAAVRHINREHNNAQ